MNNACIIDTARALYISINAVVRTLKLSENLNLRNSLKRLNRKTLGYSKSTEMYDKVIGTFIEREC